MRKARISVQKADVKNVLRAYSLEVCISLLVLVPSSPECFKQLPASSKEDLDEKIVVPKLRKAGGARQVVHCPALAGLSNGLTNSYDGT